MKGKMQEKLKHDFTDINTYQATQKFKDFDHQHFTSKGLEDILLLPNQFAYEVNCKHIEITKVHGDVSNVFNRQIPIKLNDIQLAIKPNLVDKYVVETSANFDFLFSKPEHAIPLRNMFSSVFTLKTVNGKYLPFARSSFTLRSDHQGIVTHTAAVFTQLPAIKVSSIPFDQYQVLGEDAIFSRAEELKLFEEVFSKRELMVLKRIASGDRTKTIANQLFISPKTVETHRKNMLKKLEAKSTPDMVALAKDMGLI